MRLTPDEAAELVKAAGSGDRRAWETLVEGYVGLIWAITRNHRLSSGDAQDVAQTTWLRLLENLDRLSDPARVGAWLATTARRECLRVLRQSKRQVLITWDEAVDQREDNSLPVDDGLLRAEEADEVRRGLDSLSPRCQALLSLLMLDPTPNYEEISAALGMPMGSIGPTRARCLRHLRQVLEAGGIDSVPSDVLPQ